MNETYVELVQSMQDFILDHVEEEPFPYEDLYRMTGYSRRHADRIFGRYLHKTPRAYVRSLQLTHSAQALLTRKNTILDVALSHFDSHEGYTKAFEETFGVLPSRYRQGKSFIPLFIPYSIKGYYDHVMRKERGSWKRKRTCVW